MRRITTTILLTLALSLTLSTASGQRSFLGLSFGGSIPGEEFAKKSLEEDGGYAESGFVIEFTGNYIFDYYFGISGSATFSNNGMDRVAFGEDILAGLPPANLPEDAIVDIKVGNWMYTNIMAGPLVTLPIWKLNIDLRAIAGLSIMLSPPQEIYIQVDGEEFFDKRSNQNVSFAYMFGPAIRFNFSESTALRLSADYFRSKPTFNTDESGLVYAVTGKSSYDMNIAAIHLNIGIAWRF
jgi:hypothetical protein